jgi:hypothetical protein
MGREETSEEIDFLKADIEYRIICLANSVQDSNRHRSFAPGKKWWLASKTKRSPTDAMLFSEQLGITEVQMKKVFKGRWTVKIGKQSPFLLLRERKFHGTNFVTIDIADELDSYLQTAREYYLQSSTSSSASPKRFLIVYYLLSKR